MTLKNKLNITNPIELAKEEERLTKLKAKQMYEEKFLDDLKAGTYETLSKIHFYLFSDIYDFAGKVREVNISKGNFRFAPVIYLKSALKDIEKMPQNSFEEIVEKYIEMNVAHPFREGNGRSMRIWLDHILKSEIRKVVDWSKIDKNDYLLAMERSPIKDTEIKLLLKDALSEKIDDKFIYFKGIDASYRFEGYEVYKIEDL